MSDFSNPDDVLFRLLVTVDDVWVGLAALAFTLFVVLLVCGVLFRDREDRPVWLNRLQAWLRAEEMNSALFLAAVTLCLIGVGLWLALLLVLVTGLISLLVTVPDLRPSEVKPGDFRFLIAQIAGLTAVLGAVVALPFTVIRLRLSQKQSQTAQAALFNTKITDAAADLHAMRQVSKKVDGKWETVWEDDVTRRNAAIDRLEGLVREEPQEAGRVSRLLSVYVRELSKEFPAQKPPGSEEVEGLREWSKNLEIARPDLEKAVQVLGRLANIETVYSKNLEIDLSGANLQAMDLTNLNFSGARMLETHLDGTDLTSTKFNEANLYGASIVQANALLSSFAGANMPNCNLQVLQGFASDFSYARLSETKLSGADLSSAILIWTDFTGANNLSEAIRFITNDKIFGAAVQGCDFTNVFLATYECGNLFGDGSTKLPEGTPWPEHWPKAELPYHEFNTQWREWAKTKGVVIPD